MMGCVHLQRLYQLCTENHLKLSSSDLVHFVCEQCNRQEVCPSNLMDMEEKEPSDPTANAIESDKERQSNRA